MDAVRSPRWLALTGPLFTVAFAVLVLLQGETPGEHALGSEVVAYYDDHRAETLTSVFLAPLLVTLLVLFFSHLRSLARERRVSTGAGPTVMITGAVLWAAGALVGSLLELSQVIAAEDQLEQSAETVNVLNNAAWLPFITGLAVTLIGAGLTVLSSDFLPRWLGWVALVAGVVSLAGPGGFIGFVVAPLWMLVAGFTLSRPDRVPLRDPHRMERRVLQDV